MADKKISALTAATTPLAGSEVLPIVQGGSTVKVSVGNLTAGRAVSAQSLTASNLTQNRILVAGASGAVSDLSSFTTDNSANLSFGTDAATWGTVRAIKNDTAALASFSTYTFLTQNFYYNGGNKYIGNGYAGQVIIDGATGKIQLSLSANNSSGAGAALTPETVAEADYTTKNFSVNSGNLVVGTAGKGIDFSATAGPSGGATANTEVLTDYEEGVWTPILTTTGTDFGGVTYDSRVSGRYVKIGRMVHVQGTMRTNSITVGSASGSVAIGNLPYTCANDDAGTFNGPSVASITQAESFAGDFPLNGLVLNNSTKILLLYRTAVNTGDLKLQIADLDTGLAKNFVRFSATYVAA